MKESEGGEGIQKAEEILLEEGEGAFGIEPAAEVLDEKETAELLEDPCRSTAEGGDMVGFYEASFDLAIYPNPIFFTYVSYMN